MSEVKKLSDQEQIAKEWQAFSQTLAYKKLIEYIEIQKETYSILASGPMEVFNDVMTPNGEVTTNFEFEPEKYAYLLQRGLGCDIVKIYIEGYTGPSV